LPFAFGFAADFAGAAAFGAALAAGFAAAGFFAAMVFAPSNIVVDNFYRGQIRSPRTNGAPLFQQ
jgi:hypothetical protein